MYKRAIELVLGVLFFMSGSTVAFSMNHKKAFGDDWLKAEQYVKENRAEWKRTFDELGVNAKIAEAIIFPELIRYSRWQDRIESAAVQTMYVTRKMTNFSIGRFQMKPSFTEVLENEWNNSGLAQKYGLVFDTADTSAARYSRVQRLQSVQGQCRYLAMFIRLQQIRHPELLRYSKQEQVRFLATLYNGSYNTSWQDLQSLSHKKLFHTNMIKTRQTIYYCYADIALEFYKRVN